MIYPVTVPTKGRANTSKLLSLLVAEGIPALMVLERKQIDAYAAAFPSLAILEIDGDDLGLPYARQFTMEWAASENHPWVWMLDDDISGFFRSNGKKNTRSTAQDVLSSAEKLCAPNVGQIALEYQQYSWSQSQPWKRNSYCDVAVLNRVDPSMPKYEHAMDLKLDRDYTIGVIAKGWTTIRACQLAFAAPKNGSNAGGLFADYAQPGREREASERLAAKWPGVVEVKVKKDGREDAKIHWDRIKRS